MVRFLSFRLRSRKTRDLTADLQTFLPLCVIQLLILCFSHADSSVKQSADPITYPSRGTWCFYQSGGAIDRPLLRARPQE